MKAADHDLVIIAWHQLHDGRVDFWRRLECRGRYSEKRLSLAVSLDHDAEAAIILVTGRRAYPVDDFFLQHEVHVADQVPEIEQVKQDGGRDVVGQVADDAELFTFSVSAMERGKIEFKDIRFIDDETVSAGRIMLSAVLYQSRDDVPVQFDNVELIQ